MVSKHLEAREASSGDVQTRVMKRKYTFHRNWTVPMNCSDHGLEFACATALYSPRVHNNSDGVRRARQVHVSILITSR